MTQLATACLGPAMLVASSLLLLLAGVCDIAARRVPNQVSAVLAAIGIVMRLQSGDLTLGLASAFAVFILALACWHRGWLGGGDVKLLAAAALLVPPARVPGLILSVALAGGVLAAVYVLLRLALPDPDGSRPTTRLLRILRVEQWRIRRRGPLPYASAICAGAVFMLLSH